MESRALLLWQFLCLLVTAGGWGGWAPGGSSGLVLQSLSLDPITSVGLASDPLPASYSE
jgi:hypothetical protein